MVEVGEAKGSMLFGFHEAPALDSSVTWQETHKISLPSSTHKVRSIKSASVNNRTCDLESSVLLTHVCFKIVKGSVINIFIILILQEWVHYLNEGSQISISYSISSWSLSSIGLVIAEGKILL